MGVTAHGAFCAWLGDMFPAYDARDVPDGAEPPYAMFSLPAADWQGRVAAQVDLWCDGGAAEGNNMARRLSTALRDGVLLRCDGGALWLTRGSPMWQPADGGRLTRRYCNVDVEYLTND